MTALTAARNTPQYGEGTEPPLIKLPIAASTKIYQGSMVAKNTSGLAVPASVDNTLIIVGRARRTYDNSTGAASAFLVEIERGVFYFASADVVAADVLKLCYALDDQTVSHTQGSSAAAGRIIDVDPSLGVAVSLGVLPSL